MNISTAKSTNIDSCIFSLPSSKIFDDKLDIMIIDDSRRDVELFETLLNNEAKKINYNLSRFHEVKEAISFLNTSVKLPDIIVLDLSMPSINGYMVVELLKDIARIKSIPIVIHSSMNDYENKMKVFDMKVDAFFTKPLNVKLFKSFVFGSIN